MVTTASFIILHDTNFTSVFRRLTLVLHFSVCWGLPAHVPVPVELQKMLVFFLHFLLCVVFN